MGPYPITHRIILPFLTVFLILTGCLPMSEHDQKTIPTPVPFVIDEVALSPSLSLWHRVDRTVPVIAVRFVFRPWADLEAPQKSGTAALLAEMMTQGTQTRDALALQRELRNHGISLRFSVERDGFHGLLKTTVRHAPLAFDLLQEVLTQPKLATEDLDRIRARALSNLRYDMMDAEWHASRALMTRLFSDHPYGRASSGTLETLPRITREDLVALHQTLLTQSRITIVTTGDIDGAQAGAILGPIVGALPVGKAAPVASKTQPALTGGDHRVAWDGPHAAIMFAHRGLARDDKQWFAWRLLDYIWGSGSFSSRLMDVIRVQHGLTYGVSTQLAAYEQASVMIGQAQVAQENIAQAIALIRAEAERLHQQGVSEQELADAKAYLAGSFPLSLSSTEAIAGIVLQLRLDSMPRDYIDRRAAEIHAISRDDVNRLAKEFFDPQTLTFVTAGHPETKP
jgi:zinc protease